MMFLMAQIKIKEDLIMKIKLNLTGWKIGPVSENCYPKIENEVDVLP